MLPSNAVLHSITVLRFNVVLSYNMMLRFNVVFQCSALTSSDVFVVECSAPRSSSTFLTATTTVESTTAVRKPLHFYYIATAESTKLLLRGALQLSLSSSNYSCQESTTTAERALLLLKAQH